MKRFSKFVLAALLGSMSPDVFKASAELEVSTSVEIQAKTDFYAPLATHGSWIEVGNYGRCWRPAGVAVEWRPYGYGSWVWTDCGWYWESDEPWAWACYHYGSWVYESDYGWIWVPDIEWAPAWVSWRIGGGYCGWAPLPPHGVRVAPRSFVFVQAAHFHDPVRPSGIIVNNTTVINKTTEITAVKRETRNVGGAGRQNVVVNEGPGISMVEKATGKKFRPVAIREAAGKTPVPPDAVREINESRKKQELAPARGHTESPNEKEPARKEVAPPSKRGVEPAPHEPPAKGGPGEKPSKPGKREGNGHRKGKD